MIVVTIASASFLAWGTYLFVQRRDHLKNAMLADGFLEHEVRKVLRLFDRKQYDRLADHCREVIERRHLAVSRDWTKVEAYSHL